MAKGTYEQRENSGSMFENEHKRPDRKDRDFNGTINVEGTVYWISAWKKKTGEGRKWLSLSVQKQEGRAQESRGNFREKPNGRAADDW